MPTPEDVPTGTRFSNAGRLPGETHTQPSRRSIVVLVFATLACAWIANWGALVLLDAYPQNLGYANIRAAWSRLEGAEAPPDWLVLGDSGCGHSIATQTLEESLESSVLEVCTLGDMGLLDDAWMLARHIEKTGPPASVLIVHVYDVWQRGVPPSGLLAQVPLPLGYWRRLQPDLGLDARQSTDVFMARHVPLVGERRSLKNLVKRVLAPGSSPDGVAQGDRASAENLTSVIKDSEYHRAKANSNRFVISPTNLTALDRIARLADEHGFEVYIANSPLWEGLVGDSAIHRYNEEVQEALAAFADRRESVHHLAGTMAFDVNSMVLTVDHVRQEPAISYSRDLGQRILRLNSELPRARRQ